MKISSNLTNNIEWLKSQLPIGKSYDLATRNLNLGGQAAYYIGINSLCDGELLQKILSDLEPPEQELQPQMSTQKEKETELVLHAKREAKPETKQSIEIETKQGSEPEEKQDTVTEPQHNPELETKTPALPETVSETEQSAKGQQINTGNLPQLQHYIRNRIGYVQTVLEEDQDKILTAVLIGQAVFMIDGYAWAIVIDVRDYPDRSPQEPDTEQVMGGAQDGFVENLTVNTNLIRRRIRSQKLVFEILPVGKESKTDVSLAYLEGYADEELIRKLRDKIDSLEITALTMGAKSLEELLMPKSWLHPLPVVQTTQRPDTACSYLLEGHILVMVDNTPMVLIFPCSVFQFTQSAEDYYKSPIVGTYFRVVRFFCMLMALFLMPLFLLVINSFPDFAVKINLVEAAEISNLEIFIYVLAMEFGLDLFRYSSMHASSRYSGPLSIIGGLIAGDIAVSLNWATEATVFYAAITLLATIALASIEFGEGIRIYRIFLIFTTGLAGLAGYGLWGFVIGVLLILLSVLTTPTFGKNSYLWPLFPFEWSALKTLLFRYPTSKAQPSRVWKRR